MSEETALDPTPRYRIVAGGMPTVEQTAALTIVLTPVSVPPAAGAWTAPRSGWLQAALHEGVGGRAVFSARQAADLR